MIQSFEVRKEAVTAFLLSVNPSLAVEVVPIEDPFGPSATDRYLDAIVVSKETRRGAEAVNSKRLTNGLPALKVEVVDVLPDTLLVEEKLSSSLLRRREKLDGQVRE
eukprot:TRINITY_DN1859_c1_g1_i3.p1 TRINITY_DN1859_c1_g1~~TRINITY_DN1859_c1_g1_i3.p1  ORF type:complete len:107 (-),score=37.01 TRINITY_DN1859_c1_g1_i3:146-466(-)